MKKYFLPFVIVLLCFSACIPVRALLLGAPDSKDGERFAKSIIACPAEKFSFSKSQVDWAERLRVNDYTTDLPVFRTVKEVLDDHANRAFLLIRSDTILLEYYRDDLSKMSLHPSYSVAKAFTSALTGFSIQDGFIKSEEELVVDYIPELARHPEAASLKISHLLNMTSGIDYTFPQDVHLYYGRDVWKAINRSGFEVGPGKKQSYININIQLLGIVISRATKKTLSTYLAEKIWQPLGMESDAIWSIDEKNQLEKSYCCLNATALDYAKFGRLFLEKGNWNGKQLLSEDWIEKSIRRDTLEASSYNYNYCWHIGLDAYGDYFADGLYKQYIYVHPEKKIIIVALNEREKKIKAALVQWPHIFRQLVDQLQGPD